MFNHIEFSNVSVKCMRENISILSFPSFGYPKCTISRRPTPTYPKTYECLSRSRPGSKKTIDCTNICLWDCRMSQTNWNPNTSPPETVDTTVKRMLEVCRMYKENGCTNTSPPDTVHQNLKRDLNVCWMLQGNWSRDSSTPERCCVLCLIILGCVR